MIGVAIVAVFLLASAGVYLLLEGSRFKAVLGLALLAHAANLGLLCSGRWNEIPPLATPEAVAQAERMADPLPQALVLTAIVISMAVTVYLFALVAAGAKRLRATSLEPLPEDDSGRDPHAVARELREDPREQGAES